MPVVDLYVPPLFYCDRDNLYEIIGLTNDELKAIDIKKNFHITPIPKKNALEVFISYSSQSQDVADMLVDIATSRIKDGLIIMPFKIDSAELDDECRYYLGRQEFFMGEKPPIDERITQFVNSIKKVLES